MLLLVATGMGSAWFLRVPTAAQTSIELLPLTNVWRYDQSGTNLGSGWTATHFDDAALAGPYSVVVSNGAGLAISPAATLTVWPRPTVAVARGPEALTLSWLAPPGRVFTVLASTNLVDWAELTNLVSVGTAVALTVELASGFAQRFFRLRIEPPTSPTRN